MNTTDNRLLDIELLKGFIGKQFKWFQHDEFVFTPTTYGVIYINIDNKNYALTDYYEVKDVLGDNEEISTLRIKEHNEELKSQILNSKVVCENINFKINNILLVNTKTTIVNKNDPNDKYTLLDTHGIIFNLDDGYQIAFEKDDFGENITIYRGYNLQDKFKNIPNDITSTIIDEYEATCYLEYTPIE